MLYSLLALGDLLPARPAGRARAAARRSSGGRAAISSLVGRDTDRMDAGACRRAAIESLSENLTDGFTSPLFWYVLAGHSRSRPLQGRQHDGLDGRLQDAALSALRLVRRTPGRRDELRAGSPDVAPADGDRRGPARLLGPESVSRRSGHSTRSCPDRTPGWSEAATAGAIERRLVGPIWTHGHLVTDLWLGDPSDPPLATANDYWRASALVALNGILAADDRVGDPGATRSEVVTVRLKSLRTGTTLKAEHPGRAGPFGSATQAGSKRTRHDHDTEVDTAIGQWPVFAESVADAGRGARIARREERAYWA